ncbi:MAG: hypothetical protein ACR2F8_02220, partial [Caulobacteraceae bacterium]
GVERGFSSLPDVVFFPRPPTASAGAAEPAVRYTFALVLLVRVSDGAPAEPPAGAPDAAAGAAAAP